MRYKSRRTIKILGGIALLAIALLLLIDLDGDTSENNFEVSLPPTTLDTLVAEVDSVQLVVPSHSIASAVAGEIERNNQDTPRSGGESARGVRDVLDMPPLPPSIWDKEHPLYSRVYVHRAYPGMPVLVHRGSVRMVHRGGVKVVY